MIKYNDKRVGRIFYMGNEIEFLKTSDDQPEWLKFLTIDRTSFAFNADGSISNANLKIESNTKWTLAGKPNWLTASLNQTGILGGQGTQTLRLSSDSYYGRLNGSSTFRIKTNDGVSDVSRSVTAIRYGRGNYVTGSDITTDERAQSYVTISGRANSQNLKFYFSTAGISGEAISLDGLSFVSGTADGNQMGVVDASGTFGITGVQGDPGAAGPYDWSATVRLPAASGYDARSVKVVCEATSQGASPTIATMTITQADVVFDHYEYSAITIIKGLSYSRDIPANGSAITPSTISYKQTRRSVSTTGLHYDAVEITSGATIVYSGTNVNSTTGAVSASNLGTLPTERTYISTPVATITLNGVTATTTAADVYQQANVATYGSLLCSQRTPVSLAVAGQSNYALAAYTQTVSYTSGSERAGSVTTTYAVKTAVTGYTLSSGKVTVTNNTSTSARNGFVVTISGSGEGSKTASMDVTFNQAAGAKSYGAWEISTLTSSAGTSTSSPLAASRSTATITPVSRRLWTWNGVSGSGGYEYCNTTLASSDSAATLSSTSVANGGTATLTYTSRGTSIGNRRSTTITATCSSDTSKTKTIIVYQAGNYVTAVSTTATLSYDNVWAGASVSGAPHAGGTPTFTFSSGSTSNTAPGTTYGTYSITTESYSIANTTTNGFTAIDARTGVLTVSPRGSVTGDARKSATVTYTRGVTWTPTSSYNAAGTKVSANATATATCTQNANVRTEVLDGIKSYGRPDILIGNGITAGGGSAKVTLTVSNERYYHYIYSDTAANESTNARYKSETGTGCWRITGNGNNRFGASGTVHTHTSSSVTVECYSSGSSITHSGMGAYVGTDTVTITAYNHDDVTKTRTATASATNERTKHLGDIRVYGTPSVSIGSGMTAAGGSATVSHSVINSRYYYYTYTDTSANEGTTAHYEDVAGITTIAIVSNGNSRFSLSGNTLRHESMTTNATTDTVKVRATNSGDTSKTADVQSIIINTLGTQHYKNTSGTTGDNWSYGTPSAPSLTNNLTAAWGDVIISGGSATDTKTYYRKYDSGSYTSLYTETQAAEVSYEISTNGNDRFRMTTRTKVEHATMGTTATTDTVGIKAHNKADTSKKSAEVTASVTNRLETVVIKTANPGIIYCNGASAAGGTVAVVNNMSAMAAANAILTAKYTSESTKDVTPASLTYSWTADVGSFVSYTSSNATSINVTIPSRGTDYDTNSRYTNITRQANYSYTDNGVTKSASVSVSAQIEQGPNIITGIEFTNGSAGTLNNLSFTSAAGSQRISSATNYTRATTGKLIYTSGSKSADAALTTYGTWGSVSVTYSLDAATGFSISGSTISVTANTALKSRSTTFSRTASCTLTLSSTYGSRPITWSATTPKATATQAAGGGVIEKG